MSSKVEPDPHVVSMHVEEVAVTRRQTTGDKVRVRTVSKERPWAVDEEIVHERVEIETVPIGRQVDAAPPVRSHGDTTILSVVEEIVVVERRLYLKEEVHIRKTQVTEHHRETVMVREQNAVITRAEAGTPKVEDDPRSLGPETTKINPEKQS